MGFWHSLSRLRHNLPDLPETYIPGKHYNCFLESVEPEHRQAVYEELKKNDQVHVDGLQDYQILISAPKLARCIDAYNAVLRKAGKRVAVFGLDRQTIMKLKLARPNFEVQFFTQTSDRENHMERIIFKDFDFDKAYKKGSRAVFVSHDSLSDVLFDLRQREILDAIGDIEIAVGHSADEDLKKTVNDRWTQYGLPCDEITNEERFIEPLICALKDELWDVRLRASQILAWMGKMGNARAVEPLIAVLRDEQEHPYVRREALIGLGKIGGVRAVEVIGHIVRKSEDWKIPGRYAEIPAPDIAVELLAEMGGSEVIEALVQALRDESSSVRRRAADALGKIGDARAIKSLNGCLRDPIDDVRKAAKEALERIKANKS